MGTRSAKASLKLDIDLLIANALGTTKGTPKARLPKILELAFASGTTANKADRAWWSLGRALAVGSEDFDLYDLASVDIGAGAGLDPLGQALAFAEICLLIVVNNDADGSLRVGGKATTAAWNSPFGGSDDDAYILIPPGGFIVLACPSDPAWVVADTSNHLLKVEAITADVSDYDIILLGRSA